MKKEEKRPVGTLTGDFMQLHAAGCIQTCCDVQTDPMIAFVEHGLRFSMLRSLQPNLCDGCPAFSRKCEAYQQFHTEPARLRKEKADKMVAAANAKVHEKCSICGFTVRGENHEQGDHHKQAIRGGR